MAEERLREQVWRRADEDASLSEDARLAVLAAFVNPGELVVAAGGELTPADPPTQQSTEASSHQKPVGAFLTSLTVRGFRGIGPSVTVKFQPGPGLTVIAGRNGSGKSTLAEGLELALTGVNSRWEDKGSVWTQTWRNLHAGQPAEIRVGIAEEGSGSTVIGVDWLPEASDVRQTKRWVQRKGLKQEPFEVLGWNSALEMYSPLLSYDELGQILEGAPSKFHDHLYKLLGLEQLTQAIEALDNQVKVLKQPGAELKSLRDTLKVTLAEHQDERAAAALAQIAKSKPDVDIVRPLVTEGAASTIPAAWRLSQQLAVPDKESIEAACSNLRTAAQSEQEHLARADLLAADRSRLLASALAFHRDHGDQTCPVCGEGALSPEWAESARRTMESDQAATAALATSRKAVEAARTVVLELIQSVRKPPVADSELKSLQAAHDAYDELTSTQLLLNDALADQVEDKFPAVRQTYAALRDEADALVAVREDAWAPVAIELAEWIRRAERAAQAAPTLKIASEALKWLQANATELRNERIIPMADAAREIWATLRQESNVDLGAIRLEGQKTHRRVVLEAAVDGSETEAFGVMSQGELHALALAVFLPRATADKSPFRFVVLDDPIQSMDPSKVDGFLDVLIRIAADRQVIVLTHDDRLPSAVRRSQAPARIVEVTRSVNSAVSLTESSKPAKRFLEDAYAVAADDAVPDVVKKAAIPVLCREALEATAWDIYSSRALADGRPRVDIEEQWQNISNVRQRVAAAIDPTDGTAIDKWLRAKPARVATMAVANKGMHAGQNKGVQNFIAAVQAARDTVADLSNITR